MMKDRVIYEDLYYGLLAIRDFANNAFGSYAEGFGRKEELRLSESFSLLVRDYVDLIEATSEPVDEYNERWEECNEKMAKIFGKNP